MWKKKHRTIRNIKTICRLSTAVFSLDFEKTWGHAFSRKDQCPLPRIFLNEKKKKRKKKVNNNVCHFYAHRVGKVRADQKCLRIKSAKEVQLLDQEIVTQLKPPLAWNVEQGTPRRFFFSFFGFWPWKWFEYTFLGQNSQKCILLLPVSLWSGQIT